MRTRRTTVAAAVILLSCGIPAAAQHPTIQTDSPRAELRTALRAFYFNLAHRDWEALAAQILSGVGGSSISTCPRRPAQSSWPGRAGRSGSPGTCCG
jgi:hypothetical protein